MSQKTFLPKAQTKAQKTWYIVDAEGKTLGHLATRVADLLRGKTKPVYTPHLDMGDYVVVLNAAKVRVTGKKEEDKEYIHHTGYWGHLKRKPLKDVRAKKPEMLITQAVGGMISRNRLKRGIMEKLFVYAGAEHRHGGQNPIKLEF